MPKTRCMAIPKPTACACQISDGEPHHSTIPITDETKIADVGTGPASWLVELSHQVPLSVQLDGFNISPAMFPHKAWLTLNMSLETLNAFPDVPEHLVEPDGYLQWDEARSASVICACESEYQAMSASIPRLPRQLASPPSTSPTQTSFHLPY
ncbi:MAG: hypothetical protein FRX48_07852 [Lasallia pustulata]|uniref:Uncharacterized protein n=1 Tax=Lasallia pustulata TaxID=136370 RepID=A0A5M8PFK7_9LECA|nr:MAG: hypothetical protein FRX48_07852 [Lasallia pustulata]